MAKCKICKKNIPDGTEYCKDCQDKGDKMMNESYLDGLLKSVENTAPTADEVYKKKNISYSNSPDTTFHTSKEPDTQEHDIYNVDYSDIEDFDQFNLDEDLTDLHNDIAIGDEDLFGEDISKYLADNEKDVTDNKLNENFIEQSFSENTEEDPMQQREDLEQQQENDVLQQENQTVVQGKQVQDNITNEEHLSDSEQNYDYLNMQKEVSSDIPADNINTSEINEFQEESDIDPDLNDLLKSLELDHNDIELETDAEIGNSILNKNIQPENEVTIPKRDEFEEMDSEDEDFLNLLNQISSDDPVVEDVKAINDILRGEPVAKNSNASMPGDVGEVFSDALKVVSSLNDPDAEMDSIPDMNGKKGKKKKDKKGKASSKKDKAGNIGEEKPKKSLFQLLFGNVKDEKAPKKDKQLKQSDPEIADAKEATDKGNIKKSKKGKESKNQKTVEDQENSGNNTSDKASKKDKKADKKEKKKKTKEIIQVIDEIDEDEGRINRLGAAIVFVFFGLLLLLLLTGTKVITYTLSIQNATNYFENKKYTEAYNEVYGIELKDEDIELFDKIQTVMFVNKQLNSYNNYYAMGKFPEALDSLLKGLKRYDKYIELATMLGIESDLNYVRNQILAELGNEFNLSEKAAINMTKMDSMKEYSLKVYDVVLENRSN
jgi:hypothetical protein